MPKLRFGSFLAPFHPGNENPALSLERDLELAEYLDQLGFDELWMGEHHSGGWEINASPELYIAAAAQRTKTIRLGTGVSSLPYHHPYILADRLRQLDYITKGRAMFGFGPGSLPSDAYMQGIPTPLVRDRMDEAIEPIIQLLRGETVTKKTDWFTLQDAKLQLLPYNGESNDIAVANQASPTGVRAAGMYGLNVLSIGATSTGAFNALASNWAIAEDVAREHGHTMDRSGWRLVGPVHIAETREQARQEVQWGFHRFNDYFANVAALPVAAPAGVDPVDFMVDSGFAVVGTPDDFVDQIERLQVQSGGFGCFLQLHTPWADWAQTKRSYELIARYAIPKINKMNVNRAASEDWLRNNNQLFRGELQAAVGDRIARFAAEKGAQNISPDTIEAFVKK